MSIHKSYYFVGSLLFLASCGQEELTEEPFVRSPYETVQVSAGIPMTRMSAEAEEGVAHFLWERGDLITLATADQQLPYVTTNNGASAYFYSAASNPGNPEEFLKGVEGKTVYARYPFDNKTPINMETLTTPVASGSHFLYAVDTISQAKLDLKFCHAMAYLRFHVKHDPFPSGTTVEKGGKIDVNYVGHESEIILKGNFDYTTNHIIPVETAGEMDIPYVNFMDSISLFPVCPIHAATEMAFELRCRSDEYYFHDRIDKQLPVGGLQPGHVYDIYLDFTTGHANPDIEQVMTTTKQKEYLESVAMEFMDMMPSAEFKELGQLGRYISDTYVEDYDWSGVDKWASDTFESLREALGTTTRDTVQYVWSDGVNEDKITYHSIYTNYKAVLLASNFTSQFTAENGQWTQSKADDLRFIFKDQAGQECILKLETSGEVKKAHLYNYEDWKDYDSADTDTGYVSNDYYDLTQCIIGVPEKVVVTLTQGGRQTIKFTLDIDLGTLTDENIDISKNNLTLSTLTEFQNGFKINVAQAAYEANKKASVQFAMSNNHGTLVTLSAASDLTDIPSCNVEAFSSPLYDSKDYEFDKANAKNAFVKIDILGKVQIQGLMPDVRQYYDYLDMADQDDTNEENYKTYIDKANGLVDVNLFYNGGSVKQAAVKLEPFLQDDWGYTYWSSEPVLHFFDGSSYSAFDAFFNETEFKKVIDTFKKLSNRYAELVDEQINW